MKNKIAEIVNQHSELELTARNDMIDELCDLFNVSFSFPTDGEIEERAEYMQRPRKDQSEEFIFGYMQGSDWIINKIKSNES